MVRAGLIICGAVAVFACNGALAAEAEPPRAYDPRAAFAETDKSGDGVVDHEEFIVRITEVFYQADANRDGRLSVVEIDSAMLKTEPLSQADSNEDGKVSLSEFRRARLRDYDGADEDGSGTLVVEEVTAAYEKAKGE